MKKTKEEKTFARYRARVHINLSQKKEQLKRKQIELDTLEAMAYEVEHRPERVMDRIKTGEIK